MNRSYPRRALLLPCGKRTEDEGGGGRRWPRRRNLADKSRRLGAPIPTPGLPDPRSASRPSPLRGSPSGSSPGARPLRGAEAVCQPWTSTRETGTIGFSLLLQRKSRRAPPRRERNVLPKLRVRSILFPHRVPKEKAPVVRFRPCHPARSPARPPIGAEGAARAGPKGPRRRGREKEFFRFVADNPPIDKSRIGRRNPRKSKSIFLWLVWLGLA